MPRRLARPAAFLAGCATFAVITSPILIHYAKVTAETEHSDKLGHALQQFNNEKIINKRILNKEQQIGKFEAFSSISHRQMASSTTVATTTFYNARKLEITLNVVTVSSKLYLVSAYTDLRAGTLAVKLIIYASKFFGDHLLCFWKGNLYRTELSWINFPSDELATWRAGYLTCHISGFVHEGADANTMIVLKNEASTDVSAASTVKMPLQHPLVLKETNSSSICVCVKSGYGSPSAERFVEWVELNVLLGVTHIVLYDQDLRGPIRDAMRLYIDAGRLTVIADDTKRGLLAADPAFAERLSGYDATYATGNEPYSQLELLSIQDCFHRSRGRFRYILVADIDEVIMPTTASTLQEMIAVLQRQAPHATSFSFQSASYLRQYYSTPSSPQGVRNGAAVVADAAAPTVTSATYMVAHTKRNKISWDGSKAVHDTADTTAINWHRRLDPAENVLLVHESHGWVHHYRGSCKGAACDSTVAGLVVDDGQSIMGKFARPLADRVALVTKALGL